MKHRLIALGLLASAVVLAQAQSTRQLYLVKGKKVVATFPTSDVDFITFDGTQQFYLPITLKQGKGTTTGTRTRRSESSTSLPDSL